MKMNKDRVYLHRVEIQENEAPFEVYRDLAYAALGRIDLDLPSTGTVLLKPNATVLSLCCRCCFRRRSAL